MPLEVRVDLRQMPHVYSLAANIHSLKRWSVRGVASERTP
jgi:hypothetical protein